MSEQRIKVIIVDDHKMVRDGLQVFLSVYDDIDVVGEAESGKQAIELCDRRFPDVVLMDIIMTGMDGAEATQLIKQSHPEIQVIALTNFVEGDLVQRVIQSGAIGYLLKDVHADRLASAIRDAQRGRGVIDVTAAQALAQATNAALTDPFELTTRECEILELMVQGKTNKEIAAEFKLSLGTVRFHVSNVLSKLGVSNRTEAVRVALDHQIIEK